MKKHRLLKIRDVCGDTSLSRTQVYALMATGEFPKQVVISKRAVAWSESQVQAWIEDRLTSNLKKEGSK